MVSFPDQFFLAHGTFQQDSRYQYHIAVVTYTHLYLKPAVETVMTPVYYIFCYEFMIGNYDIITVTG